MAFEADPCALRTEAGELIARGFVRQHDDEVLVVDARGLPDSWLAEGDSAMVEVFNTDRGALTYRGVVDFAAAGRVRLSDLRLQVVRQQRAALRVPTDFPVDVVARVGSPEADGAEEELDPPWQVTVIDLSAHGLRFLAADGAERGSTWRLRLPAPRRHLDLAVEVVRIEELRSGVAHGCRFVDARERDHDVLFGWVLDLQRQQLAKRADQR